MNHIYIPYSPGALENKDELDRKVGLVVRTFFEDVEVKKLYSVAKKTITAIPYSIPSNKIKNGITFEDFESQEQFVRKFDALEAVRLERKAVANEFKAWFLLNMEFRMDEPVAKAILDKLKEIV